jgi:hypothetical protein
MKGILNHLKKLKISIPKSNKLLIEAVINSWSKLRKYYELIDNNYSIYAAATLFYSYLRMTYFNRTVTLDYTAGYLLIGLKPIRLYIYIVQIPRSKKKIIIIRAVNLTIFRVFIN